MVEMPVRIVVGITAISNRRPATDVTTQSMIMHRVVGNSPIMKIHERIMATRDCYALP